MNLRVGIATGPWKTVAEDPGAGPATRPVRDVMTDEERRTLTARMREIERQYEGKPDRPPGVPLSPTAAKYQLDRLLQEESRIQAELAGLNARYQHITEELRAGGTPPEIEKQIETDTRYLNARQRLDDIDVELDGLIERRGEQDDLVISWKRRGSLPAETDEVREELKRKYAEQAESMYKDEIDATTANIAPLHAQFDRPRGIGRIRSLKREDRSITERTGGQAGGVRRVWSVGRTERPGDGQRFARVGGRERADRRRR